jgi:hypothetical protein
MKTSTSSKHIGLTAACALALSLVSGAALAQGNTAPEMTQIWHNPDQTIWRSAYGLCWHSTFGPPPSGECDPAPVAQYVAPAPAPAPYVAPPPAPVYVAPAPAPVIPPEMPRKKDRN